MVRTMVRKNLLNYPQIGALISIKISNSHQLSILNYNHWWDAVQHGVRCYFTTIIKSQLILDHDFEIWNEFNLQNGRIHLIHVLQKLIDEGHNVFAGLTGFGHLLVRKSHLFFRFFKVKCVIFCLILWSLLYVYSGWSGCRIID